VKKREQAKSKKAALEKKATLAKKAAEFVKKKRRRGRSSFE